MKQMADYRLDKEWLIYHPGDILEKAQREGVSQRISALTAAKTDPKAICNQLMTIEFLFSFLSPY